MIYLRLFFEFFKTGLFAVGGGLATLPFLTQMQQKDNWFSAEALANMIAVSESTPGPIGVNMATYVGFKDWQDYCACQESKNDYSSEFVKHSAQHCFLMQPGEKIRISWYPNRTLVLRHEGDGDLFSVVASENSKLEPGMTLHCETFTAEEPLLLKNVKGGSLAEACDYLCGKIGGIEYELMGK